MPACKPVSYNLVHVENYLNSKKRKLFGSEDQDSTVALDFLSAFMLLRFEACLFFFVCMSGRII